MPVSHAPETAVTSENRDEKKVPGLLEMLAQVPDLRKRRGRRYELVFVLAVAACCALAGAKTYREIGDQAADLPQDVLARLGGRIHPLKRAIIAPSEKRIRTLIQAIDAGRLDQIIGGWLRALAQAGKLEPLLTAIAIDGKWLRGIADGTEKLFAAMLHDEKVIIGQHRIPEGTNEITQVKELLDAIDLVNCARPPTWPTPSSTPGRHCGEKQPASQDGDYAVTVEGNQPASSGTSTTRSPRTVAPESDHEDLDFSHGRSPAADRAPVPPESISRPDQENRIRRDAYDITGTDLPRRSSTASPAWTRNAAPPRSSPRSPGASGPLNRCTGCVIPPGGKTRTPATPDWAPGHGVPEEHRGQPAAYRRGHRDPPDPPGHLP